MVGKDNALIKIDLAQSKLHINVKDKLRLSLHFDSESRRFYLAVIALVLHEMKKSGNITSIPLEKHYDKLVLLNETVGGGAGSSDRERLLPRIYMKWKDALPDLEHGPLFKVLGKKKEYDDAVGKTYQFTEEEKDAWANLFDYKGSLEQVRLRFSIDKLGVTLDDVLIVFEDETNPSDENGWDGFLKILKKSTKVDMEQVITQVDTEEPAVSSEKGHEPRYRQGVVLALTIVAVVVAAAIIWNFHLLPISPTLEVVSEKRMAFPLPEKPSIAVLPFTNMSGDPEQDYFSDGITEDIITTLSKLPNLFVIARNSTFTYKGKPVKIHQVAEELGVRYVLEGSVQKSDRRVRITAQLVDTLTGRHLWAERYDRELKDIFTLQDEITKKIVVELQVKLTEGEQARVQARGTDSLEAWANYYKGVEGVRLHTKEGNINAQRMFNKAVEIDPQFAAAYVGLGYTHKNDARFGWSESPSKSYKMAFEMAYNAAEMDDSYSGTHTLLGLMYLMMGQHDKAIAEGEKAVALNPNGADDAAILASIKNFSGEPEEAINLMKKAMRLSPYLPDIHLGTLIQAYQLTGRHEEAIEIAKTFIKRKPNLGYPHAQLALSYAELGRYDEARKEWEITLEKDPNVMKLFKSMSKVYKDQSVPERFRKVLRNAGLM